MHQREGVLHIKSTVGRDVRLEEVPAMIAKLSDWARSTETVMHRLEMQSTCVVPTTLPTIVRTTANSRLFLT